jgi:hypothetical protein
MPQELITDHDWHDIRREDLPFWIRPRIAELNRHPLVGKSFEYRRDPATGRYQRRLRSYASKLRPKWARLMRWLRARLWRIPLIIAAVASVLIVIAAVASGISGLIRLASCFAIVLAGIGLMAYIVRLVTRRRPRLVPISVSLIVALVFTWLSAAYMDIGSWSDFTTTLRSAFQTDDGEFRSRIDALVERSTLELTDTVPPDIVVPDNEAPEVDTTVPEDDLSTSAESDYVMCHGAYIIGADGHYIELFNNPDAHDPSWKELEEFLREDDTDTIPYDFSSFVCADFAERLHNNAEQAGLRTAYVTITLGPCDYYPTIGGHALNAFDTTDEGLVFVDCTGLSEQGPKYFDKVVSVEEGQEYQPRLVFKQSNWSTLCGTMGEVLSIDGIQW